MAARAKKKAATRKSPAKRKVKPIPDGYPPLMPTMVLDRCREAIAFYVKVLGARDRVVMDMPDGKVGHAELSFGPSVLMLGDSSAGHPATPGRMVLYTRDCDATYRAALAAGATSLEAPKDQWYGERMARLTDPFGVEWSVMTHIEDLTPREMKKRMAAMAPPA